MRRVFLSQLIATGLCMVFGTSQLVSTESSQAQDTVPVDWVIGKWHLLRYGENEFPIPRHRMDLLFRKEGAELKGAILSRSTGEEIPLAFAKFDGSTLRLQMKAPPGQEQTAMLTMKKAGTEFEGHWMKSETEPTGPLLKLVRSMR
jgi:hypothetical protein